MDHPTEQQMPEGSSSLRSVSPSPSATPSFAGSDSIISERSVSLASSASTYSRSSSDSKGADGLAGRRRGYARPLASNFANSARSRESVMSLGTITHLQYYFARTGLLDGKGGQLSKAKSPGQDMTASRCSSDSSYASTRSSPNADAVAERMTDGTVVASPTQQDDGEADGGCFMLPPTVSTYNHRIKAVPRPPSMHEMRSELRAALVEATQVLQTAEADEAGAQQAAAGGTGGCASQGWHEIQGMHMLDLMTLAIGAAKMYYTAHEQPARLWSIKSERRIREELLTVMDTLKRMASRSFAGGLRSEERQVMQQWTAEVAQLLAREDEQETAERRQRESWPWLSQDWTGDSREQARGFLTSFDASPDALRAWHERDAALEQPSTFLATMHDGVRLIQLHNSMVAQSRRRFGQVSVFHADTTKPYRRADNLRYWIKAAELRWDIVLHLDVMAVVHGRDAAAWRALDREILRWCGQVREEFVREWTEPPPHTSASVDAPRSEPIEIFQDGSAWPV